MNCARGSTRSNVSSPTRAVPDMAVAENPDQSDANPHPRPPSLLLAAIELQRALGEASTLPAAWPLLRRAPRGDGHPVLVLPGYTASDLSTVPLRRYLSSLGY